MVEHGLTSPQGKDYYYQFFSYVDSLFISVAGNSVNHVPYSGCPASLSRRRRLELRLILAPPPTSPYPTDLLRTGQDSHWPRPPR